MAVPVSGWAGERHTRSRARRGANGPCEGQNTGMCLRDDASPAHCSVSWLGRTYTYPNRGTSESGDCFLRNRTAGVTSAVLGKRKLGHFFTPIIWTWRDLFNSCATQGNCEVCEICLSMVPFLLFCLILKSWAMLFGQRNTKYPPIHTHTHTHTSFREAPCKFRLNFKKVWRVQKKFLWRFVPSWGSKSQTKARPVWE